MTQKPGSKLPQDAQPWARWLEAELASVRTENARLNNQLENVIPKQDRSAPEFSNAYYEIKKLYEATGNVYPPVDKPPPAVPAARPVTYTTKEFVADWSRTWGSSSYYTGSSTHVNGSYLYQGSNPENKIGIFHFAMGSALGKSFTNAQIYVRNIDSPFQSSFTAGFGTHGYNSAPSGKPSRNGGWSVSWGRGQGKWIAVPKAFWAGMSNGSIDGFSIGGIGPSNPNYAFFYGVGTNYPPRLKITYRN